MTISRLAKGKALVTAKIKRMRLTAVYEEGEDGWINARVLELPGANTCARTLDEARELLADAVRELVASYADDAERLSSRRGTRFEPLDVTLA